MSIRMGRPLATRAAGVGLVGLVGLVVQEALVLRSYLDRGATFHYLLHNLYGLGAGLAVGALVRRGPALAWALAGQLVSITPDLLFVFGHRPHALWMDVFLGHIHIHASPVPVLSALACFLLAGWASALRHRWLALVALAVLAVSLSLARPIPDQLSDLTPSTGAILICR